MKRIFITLILVLFTLAINAQVKVLGKIEPNGPADTYPTHVDSLGKGGLMAVGSWQERNAIPLARRKAGMLVRVKSAMVDSTYTIGGNLNNPEWMPFVTGGNSLTSGNALSITNNKINLGGPFSQENIVLGEPLLGGIGAVTMNTSILEDGENTFRLLNRFLISAMDYNSDGQHPFASFSLNPKANSLGLLAGVGMTYVDPYAGLEIILDKPNQHASVELKAVDPVGGTRKLALNGDGSMVIVDNILKKGLEEDADYSANKTQYSYVTKKMLDSATIGGSPDPTKANLAGDNTFTGNQSILGNLNFSNSESSTSINTQHIDMNTTNGRFNLDLTGSYYPKINLSAADDLMQRIELTSNSIKHLDDNIGGSWDVAVDNFGYYNQSLDRGFQARSDDAAGVGTYLNIWDYRGVNGNKKGNASLSINNGLAINNDDTGAAIHFRLGNNVKNTFDGVFMTDGVDEIANFNLNGLFFGSDYGNGIVNLNKTELSIRDGLEGKASILRKDLLRFQLSDENGQPDSYTSSTLTWDRAGQVAKGNYSVTHTLPSTSGTLATMEQVLAMTKVQTQTFHAGEILNQSITVTSSPSRLKKVYIYNLGALAPGDNSITYILPNNPITGDLVEFVSVSAGEMFDWTTAIFKRADGLTLSPSRSAIVNAWEWNGTTWLQRVIDGQ